MSRVRHNSAKPLPKTSHCVLLKESRASDACLVLLAAKQAGWGASAPPLTTPAQARR